MAAFEQKQKRLRKKPPLPLVPVKQETERKAEEEEDERKEEEWEEGEVDERCAIHAEMYQALCGLSDASADNLLSIVRRRPHLTAFYSRSAGVINDVVDLGWALEHAFRMLRYSHLDSVTIQLPGSQGLLRLVHEGVLKQPKQAVPLSLRCVCCHRYQWTECRIFFNLSYCPKHTLE